MKELLRRLLTGVVYVILLLSAVFLSSDAFDFLFMVFGLACLYEYKRQCLKKILLLIITLISAFVLINLFESFIDYYWLVGFFSSESESYLSYLNYNSISGFFILLLGLSYALIKYWFQSEKLKRVLYEEKLSTEMAFLKAQINPHFLFNSLNCS